MVVCAAWVDVRLLSRDYDSRGLTHSGKKCVKELNKQKAQDEWFFSLKAIMHHDPIRSSLRCRAHQTQWAASHWLEPWPKCRRPLASCQPPFPEQLMWSSPSGCTGPSSWSTPPSDSCPLAVKSPRGRRTGKLSLLNWPPLPCTERRCLRPSKQRKLSNLYIKSRSDQSWVKRVYPPCYTKKSDKSQNSV